MTINNIPKLKEVQENIETCETCGAIQKACKWCGVHKPLDRYLDNNTFPRGNTGVCIDCYVGLLGIDEDEFLKQQYERDRKDISRDIIKDYQSNKKKSKRGRHLINMQNSAHNAVHAAIQRGDLEHPSNIECVICGNTAQEYHHWAGYDKKYRLVVLPLCIPCHRHVDRAALKFRK